MVKKLDKLLYYIDLFNGTSYDEVFYYRYIDDEKYTYLDIASFIDKGASVQIYRMLNKIEKFVEKIIESEKEYKELKAYLSTTKM